MLFGACAGSTTGGIKCIRIAIMSRISKNEFKHIIHPNAILPVRIKPPSYFINNQVSSTCIHFSIYGYYFYWMAGSYAVWSRI
mgnify:CR=1 FL=1